MQNTNSRHTPTILLSALLLALTVLFFSRPTAAIPSFARQTGQPCSQCHTQAFGPALTPFGRQFKLNGYVLSIPNQAFPPLAAMVEGSFTHTREGQPDGAAKHFGDNDNIALDQVSLFYGGRTLIPKVGVFSQLTYDGVERHTALDNTDIRFANQTTVADNSLVYGLTLNNSPTVQDLWNTTPTWGFPYASSPLTPTPAATALIDGGLSQQVLGLTAYSLWNDLLYGEVGAYDTLSKGVQDDLGVRYEGENQIDQPAPYWRLALQHVWGGHYFSLGTYGLRAKVFPERDQSAGTDRYTDIGIDASYQSLFSNEHLFGVNTTFIREDQNRSASEALGNANRSSHTLNSFRINASYTFQQTYGFTLGYFQTTGTTDTGLYQPEPISGSASGSPDSRGYILQLDYIPFGKTGSFGAPWLNTRFTLQYAGYTKFNGSGSNYDGFGRDARDNNTLYLLAWLAL